MSTGLEALEACPTRGAWMACVPLGIWGSGAAPAWSHYHRDVPFLWLSARAFARTHAPTQPTVFPRGSELLYGTVGRGPPGWEAEITLHPEALFSVIGALLVCLLAAPPLPAPSALLSLVRSFGSQVSLGQPQSVLGGRVLWGQRLLRVRVPGSLFWVLRIIPALGPRPGLPG